MDRILVALRQGASYALAANYGGISYETFRKWRETKPAFRDAIMEAEGDATVKWLAKIEQAASDGSWQAAAWKLERRYPQDYGRTVIDQNIGGQKDNAIRFIIEVDDEDNEE